MNRSSVPTGTFAYAVFWGGLSTALALISPQEFPTPTMAILTSILGVAVIALGYGVYRRKQFAAWAFVAFSALDVGARILSHGSGYIMRGLLFWDALASAVVLRREAQLPATQN